MRICRKLPSISNAHVFVNQSLSKELANISQLINYKCYFIYKIFNFKPNNCNFLLRKNFVFICLFFTTFIHCLVLINFFIYIAKFTLFFYFIYIAKEISMLHAYKYFKKFSNHMFLFQINQVYFELQIISQLLRIRCRNAAVVIDILFDQNTNVDFSKCCWQSV